MLACILWFAILALALPQAQVETVTQSLPTPTPPKKTPGLRPGYIVRPFPKSMPPAWGSWLQHLSSILIPGLTPTPMPMPTTSVVGEPPASMLIITVTPGGGVTTVTSLITSVVIASPPPSTVTKWVPPSNVAKREEQLPEEEGEDAPFTPTITHLPEAAPESEQEKEDDYDMVGVR
ncbi:uncharacterized protein ALTATR162_LOCUS4174 [Alternaria atra]|uniref:Uncharacterized protein n=1 Tax=Alternaria atra TaxID=119953 RepID=A0A8J2HY54_9PLEO|nr:uncharacterized protein ALTATR162_LOCUS4174 [Alternaria atra]CAG5156376.1 unnamed protein product [Alternaria atra]